ncbi:FHA domain-containing protein [Photobacterium sanctipauli]|uniref:FHA domain-containing protein n=1 Tax=Photobacterium sanctipauli TaxID=1342794 RepID=A0A2T3NYQ1_9GAMM|nr:FHA domain-containing protein [Photobacterium sanctipauli]PSW21404.1 FHA domain-containing protein [Photobacterium sanctipauli]
MTISFQLIDIPDNEQVDSRQVSLPASGGTLGRSYECTIQLPDFNRTLSRIHAEIRPHPLGGYQVIDRSINGLLVNDVLQGKGVNQKISDGDKIKLGGYTLLVSDIDALFNSDSGENSHSRKDKPDAVFNNPEASTSAFNFSRVDEDFQDIALAINSHVKLKDDIEAKKQTAPFSSEDVLADDVFGYDPFDDEEEWQTESKQAQSDHVVMLEEDAEPILPSSQALTIADNEHADELRDSLNRLNAIIEQQERSLSASIDRERLVASIEATLERFLEHLNPAQLEDEYDDYITGWGNKDKKYWALYKKQFQRKHERRDFYRLFSSILFEELSEKK